jgi:hypothetical protein
MAEPGDMLRDVWTPRPDGRMVAEGDAGTINDWLATKLVKLKIGDWRILYRHRETSQLWELSYPMGEMHGGGPRLLSCLAITDPDQWI